MVLKRRSIKHPRIKAINIKTVRASAKFLAALEQKGLIRVLKPAREVLDTRTRTGAVSVHYRSNEKFGGHCLLGVGKRNTDIEFSFHPDNEDLVLLNPGKKPYKPLFLVLSLLKKRAFLETLRAGGLRPEDFTAVRLEYNDPGTMFFTVLKDTVHCEITLPGRGQHPVFFVSEPSRLSMNRIKTGGYAFRLAR